tara:strand:- start:329 stop:784 length:456 start_codon:yes stop_codon:yes gene_type:complete
MISKKYTTSWPYEDLKSLTNLLNHKSVFDGYSYVWKAKIKGKWINQSVKLFDTEKEYKSVLIFTMYRWSKELQDRDNKIFKDTQLKELKTKKELDKKYKTIVKISSKNLKPLKKIELILEVANDVPNEMIYKAIGISKATFYRHLNYINKH